MRSNRRSGTRGTPIRLICALLVCVLSSAIAQAWHTENHQRITQAAVDLLPEADRALLGSAINGLVEEYCMYPDRYRSALNEDDKAQITRMKPYVHLPLLEDLGSLHGTDDDASETCFYIAATLMNSAVRELRDGAPEEAARYLGTLAHYIEDSASPVHTVDNKLLRELLPVPEHLLPFALHARVEQPTFPLPHTDYPPRLLGKTVVEGAVAVYPRLVASRRVSRAQNVPILQAIYVGDEDSANTARAKAAQPAVELLADILHTVCVLARGTE